MAGLSGVPVIILKEGSKREGGREAQHRNILAARAAAEAKMVRIVKNEADKNWRAAVWWLERAAKERWGISQVEESPASIPIPRVIIEVVDG